MLGAKIPSRARFVGNASNSRQRLTTSLLRSRKSTNFRLPSSKATAADEATDTGDIEVYEWTNAGQVPAFISTARNADTPATGCVRLRQIPVWRSIDSDNGDIVRSSSFHNSVMRRTVNARRRFTVHVTRVLCRVRHSTTARSRDSAGTRRRLRRTKKVAISREFMK